MEDKETYTILDVLPNIDISNPKEVYKQSQSILEKFSEHGKVKYSPDEVAFMMLLDHCIEMFERTKTMLCKQKITVQLQHTASSKDAPRITDFSVINVSCKTS